MTLKAEESSTNSEESQVQADVLQSSKIDQEEIHESMHSADVDVDRESRGVYDNEREPIPRRVSWSHNLQSVENSVENFPGENPKQQRKHNTSVCASPLSWAEARNRIREVLERYMKSQPPAFQNEPDTSEKNDSGVFWYDLDLWASALPASIALLVLSCVAYSSQTRDEIESTLNARAHGDVHKSQIAASILFLVGSLFSIILVRRRRDTCTKDGDVSKRHTILKFLVAMRTVVVDRERGDDKSSGASGELGEKTHDNKHGNLSISLPGTSLIDIYPAYRRSSTKGRQASWHRIPTLLLSKGDFISLQIGDIAPAKCSVIGTTSTDQVESSIILSAGERVSLESFGEDSASALSSLPRGRTTLPPHSRELLSLCNKMKIFILQETPLESLLYLPQVKKRTPQLHRQIAAVRLALFLVAIGVFVLAAAIICLRPHLANRDLSLILPIPFLAALGVLPVTTPMCAFFLEVFGTARILVAVHPHVSRKDSFQGNENDFKICSNKKLFLRYVLATATSRLSVQNSLHTLQSIFGPSFRFLSGSKVEENSRSKHKCWISRPELVHVPPASSSLLEKLGVATAFAMVDDELACEPHSTPQQLLIPSGKGMKLLDLCPAYDSESENDDENEIHLEIEERVRKGKGKSYNDSDDSDSDDEQKYQHISMPKRKLKALRKGLRKRRPPMQYDAASKDSERPGDENEVQFEDPLWWQHLPSLKCIGLACLLVDDIGRVESEDVLQCDTSDEEKPPPRHLFRGGATGDLKNKSIDTANRDPALECALESFGDIKNAEKALVAHICSERNRSQLQSLARCIGFSTERNTFGQRGDLSNFHEVMRLHVVSAQILKERLAIDTHALGLEESRCWDMIRSDSTSVIVQDRRSKAYQLLTVGDARVVAELCQEAWQGENSTILPLSSSDKQDILDTSNSWRLADLDIAAFSYTPVPHTWEQSLVGATKRSSKHKAAYLVDRKSRTEPPHSGLTSSEDWSLVKNQIFLGVLGSLVTPRKEIKTILDVFNAAGIRFVYFSPRNMRRTKELASQMGIDVAWNCAISLRPLDEGKEDPHRMTSTYADWDINAKLPHGIDAVRLHLEEVDNVPLLVSLFTDVTKDTTKEMLQTFQDKSDTVIVMGLSHLTRNAGIFACADLAISTDVLSEGLCSESVDLKSSSSTFSDALLPCEVAFVSSIASHSCCFKLFGASSTSHMPFIITQGRAALEAATSAGLFVVSGCLSFALYVLLCVCTVSTTLPFVPLIGSVLYIQVILPLIGIAMAMNESDTRSMERVPPKNDQSVTFGQREKKRLYINSFMKALPPAVLPQLLHLIVFGELVAEFEPELVSDSCSSESWISLVRCEALWTYSGAARTSAGSLVLAEMVLCVVVASSSFVYRTIPIRQQPPWKRNQAWLYSVALSIVLVAVFLIASVERGTFAALSWYVFLLGLLMPFICICCNEAVKSYDAKNEKRAVMLRRLQFETRLGMWSPK